MRGIGERERLDIAFSGEFERRRVVIGGNQVARRQILQMSMWENGSPIRHIVYLLLRVTAIGGESLLPSI